MQRNILSQIAVQETKFKLDSDKCTSYPLDPVPCFKAISDAIPFETNKPKLIPCL